MLDKTAPNLINAAIVYNPLDVSDRTETQLVHQPGKSLVHYIDGLPDDIEWAVALDGVAIPKEGLSFTFPQQGSSLVVMPVPQGGGESDGKAILAMVATVALSIFAPYAGAAIAKGIGLGASKLAVSLATASVSIAGGVLINALIPPPEQASSSSEAVYGIDGPKNTSTEGVPYPVLYGEHAFGGNLIDLYTENATDENGKAIQYLYGRTLISEGPIKSVGQIYLNDQAIENYDEVEVDYRLGYDTQSVSPWFNQTVSLFNQGKSLTTNWQTYTTSQEVDKIRIDLVAPAGLGSTDSKGRKHEMSVDVEVEVSKTGQNDWQPVLAAGVWRDVEPGEIVKSIKVVSVVRSTQRRERGSDSESYNVTIQYRQVGAATWTTLETKSGTLQPEQSTTFEFIKTDVPLAEYEARTVINSGNNIAEVTTIQHKAAGSVTLTEKSTDAIRRSYSSEHLDEAIYDIRFRRTTEEDPDNSRRDNVVLSDIGEIKVEQISLPYTAWLGVKVKLTGQLNGVPTITGVGEGRVMTIYDHNGEAVDTRYSNNPADVALDAYMHTRYGGQMEHERIDFASFSEWRDYCTDNNLTFNGLFYDMSNLDDALKHVYIAGRAQRVSSGAKLAVAVDRPTNPTMMFSDGNIKSGSMQITYLPFADRINDLEISFNDKDNKYARRSVRVTNDAALNRGEPLKSSSIELKGVTDQMRALREGTLRMNYNRLVKRTAVWESPVEAVGCAVGDVVIVQHKMPGWGKGGRLMPASDATTLVLDQEVDIDPSKTYRVLVHQDSKIHLSSVSVNTQTGNLITIDKTITNEMTTDRFKTTTHEFGIRRVVDANTLLLDDEAADVDLTSVTSASLIEVDYVEDAEVLNPITAGSTDVITLTAPLSSTPGEYPSYIFGEVQFTKKPFRIKTITRTADSEIGITAVEYVEEVYLDDPEAQAHNYSSLTSADQVKNLTIEESIRQRGADNVSYAVVRWEQPDVGIYVGAILQVSINGSSYEDKQTLSGTEAEFRVEKGDVVRVRVLSKVYGTDKTVEAGLASVVQLNVSGVVEATPAPTGWVGVSGVRSVTLSGPAPSEDNSFSHFEFYAGNGASTFATASYIGRSDASIATFTVPETSTNARYWVVEVDTAGNKSPESARISVLPTSVTSSEISNNAVTEGKVSTDLANKINAGSTASETINGAAPSVPTGLTVSSSALDNGVSDVTVTWIGSVTGDPAYYEVEVTVSGSNPVTFNAGDKVEWRTSMPSGTALSVRVRAVNGFGKKSNFSSAKPHTAATDSVAPSKLIDFTATPAFNAVWLEWTESAATDISHYKIYESSTTTKPSNASFTSTASTFVRSGLDDGVLKYYWVSAVDISGNESTVSDRKFATTLEKEAITAADIQGVVESTSFAQGIEPVTITTGTLPTAKSTNTIVNGGKLYRWDGTAYTSAVPTVDLVGTITSAQVATLDASKLTGTLNEARIQVLNASKLTGTVAAARITAVNATALTGTIAATNIADNSISTPKLAAGSITTAKLAVGAVDAGSIAAGAIVAGKIAADAVTSANIVAGTITSANIAAGGIQADNIAANTISASKLVLSDTSNLCLDSQFQDPDAWDFFGRGELEPNATTWGNGAKGAIYSNALDAGDPNWRNIARTKEYSIPVKEGVKYRYTYSTRRYNSGLSRARMAMYFQGADGVYIGSAGLGEITNSTTTPASTTGELTIPAGASLAKIALQFDPSYPSGVIFRSVILNEMNAGELLVDGTITSNKIATNAVSTDKLAANSITSDKIVTNAITTSHISAGAVNTDQLAAGSIVAEKMGIGDFTNLVSGSDFEDIAKSPWPMVTGLSWSSNAHTGTRSLALTTSRTAASVHPTTFPVEEGDQYYVEFWARKSSNYDGDGNNKIRIADAISGQLIGAVNYSADAFSTHDVFEKISGTFTVNAGTSQMRIQIGVGVHTAGVVYLDNITVRRMNGGELIVDGSLKANHFVTDEAVITGTAQIANAVITEAKITGTLNANKITGGTALLNTVTVNGQALGTVQGNANDPAARVNAAATKIDPGKITISGSTTLQDWRMGGDETRINGGNISANTISANKLEIGSRNITLTGITFEHNSPSANSVSWTAGSIRYVDDNGATTTVNITAGNITWTSGIRYIYWTKGDTNLKSTTGQGTAFSFNNVILATYEGGTKLDADYGRTVIDGDRIKTGSITAQHINTTGLEVTGTMIVNGATKRTAFASNWSTNTLTSTNWTKISSDMDLILEPYTYTGGNSIPDNPLCVTFSVDYRPNTNAEGRLDFSLMGWNGSAWENTYIGFVMQPEVRFRANNSGWTMPYCTVLVDNDSANDIPSRYTRFAISAKLVGAGNTSVSVESLSVKMEQLNR